MEGEGLPLASVCKRSYAIPSAGENPSNEAGRKIKECL